MRKSAVEQVRLQARAKAMEELTEAVDFSLRTGSKRTWKEEAEASTRVAQQAVAKHIREHGEWVPA